MATRIYKMRDNNGNKEQYPFLEIENGMFYEMRDNYGNSEQNPILEIVNSKLYKMRDNNGNKEQYPFLELDGRFSIADLVVILMQVGEI